MVIKTELELVRYIRHQIAGSDHQDVQAVKEFVNTSTTKRLTDLLAASGLSEEDARFLQQKYFELYPAAKPT